jgi:hypothetical protein
MLRIELITTHSAGALQQLQRDYDKGATPAVNPPVARFSKAWSRNSRISVKYVEKTLFNNFIRNLVIRKFEGVGKATLLFFKSPTPDFL